MTPFQQILGLLNQVQSQDELREVGKALNRRFRALQPSAAQSGFKPGDPVEFDARGQTLRGKVKKVNEKSVSVVPDGGGAEWRVGPSLLRPAKPAARRPEPEVLDEIKGVYAQLSPENLTCDGELARGEVVRKERQLRSKLESLFAEIGRRVSEDEAYAA